MTDNDKRRHGIFIQYSTHLAFLRDSGILDIDLKFDRTYICPVCLRQFSEADLDQSLKNPLTLEDAPPKSLGGKASILICKECNNNAGHYIDVHLAERMNELDNEAFLPGVVFAAQTENNGLLSKAKVSVSENREITIRHDIKKNHPGKLNDYIEATGRDTPINILFEKKADPVRMQLALLKTGYLLTFVKFGYAFILNDSYNRVRDQLRHPEQLIYPTNFWFNFDALANHYGVPFITEPGLEAIFPIFALKTKFSERAFGTAIPLTTKPIEVIIAELKGRFAATKGFHAEMDAMEGADFLFDYGAITNMLAWIAKLAHNDLV
jgi:hypothetical protein